MTPLRINEWLHDMNLNVVEASESAGLAYLENLFWQAKVSRASDREFRLQLGGYNFVVRTNSLPWFQTADGGVVTDFCLQTRELFMALCAPLLGRRYDRTARDIADWYRGVLLAFMSGGETGGAVYAFGKWSISPRWVPIAPPQVLPVEGALYDDPFTIIGRTFQTGDNLRAENITKAMKLSVDPLYHMFRVAGTAVLTVPQFEFVDVQNAFKDWRPQLVYAGGDAMDVVTRAGTFVGDPEAGDWRSSAYDETAGSGRILAVLQQPALFDQTGISARLKNEDGTWWFLKSDKDHKLGGQVVQECVDLLPRLKDLKLSWLSQRLGVRLVPGAKITALYASPLFFINQGTRFRVDLSPLTAAWVVSAEALAWVRSDPRSPQGLLRFAGFVGKTISEAWLTPEEVTFLKQKGWYK